MPGLNRIELLKNEYIEWLLLDKHQKAVANLPMTDKEWAKIKNTTDRTLRYWKQDPKFIEAFETRQREHALKLHGATALPIKPSENLAKDTDSSEYLAIKNKLVERAKSGDRASAELYFKTYGKIFVDEELASRKSDFREMDTDALYDRVLLLVPVEKIEAFLAGRKNVLMQGAEEQ